jgi:site-specific recombinase XerD
MTGYDLSPLAASWLRSLRARDLSTNTQRIYRRAITELAAYLMAYEPPAPDGDEVPRPAPTALEGPDGIHREHIEHYMISLIQRTSAGNAHQHFRSLRTFFSWCVDEEEMTRSPMRKMKPPTAGDVEVPVIPDDALKKLFNTCKGTNFIDRRDRAIMLMFLDTGGRLSEITNRTQEKVDLDLNVLHVLGKGNRERPLPFGRATAQAMDRYLRTAAKYLGRSLTKADPLWISYKRRDALTVWGVGQMIERRCQMAGIPHIHPHQFRHTFAHQWKLHEGNEDALMRIMGWKSREMLSRYGASAGEERARLQHQELSPGDRIK